MTTNKLDLALESERSEEVQHIIERMPTKFGFWVSLLIAVLFLLIGLFGWIIRYPDVVNGQIIVNAQTSPIKLIANSNGKLRLNHIKSMDNVKEGEIIAYVDNPTNPNNVIHIDSMIKRYNPNSDSIMELSLLLPQNVSVGELNLKYYAFVNALREFINYKRDRMYDKQGQGLNEISSEQKKAILSAEKRVDMSINTQLYMHKFYSRDSILFVKRVISESELDKTQMSYTNAKDAYQSTLNNLITAKQQLQQTQNQLQQLGVEKPEKETEIHMALVLSYNDLVDNIKSWEQKYVFRSPYDGKVQFLKFYSENQFILAGEEVFTVIPKQDNVLGQVTMPSRGTGKIKAGQEVIVKLDSYPYMEYGSISGRVSSISLTSNVTKVEGGNVDTYQILVNFPNQLLTNYGAKLGFKAEAKGTAEIVTNDRRLIERLFDNLNYALKNK